MAALPRSEEATGGHMSTDLYKLPEGNKSNAVTVMLLPCIW